MPGCTQYMPSYTLPNCFIPLHSCLVRIIMPKKGEPAAGRKGSGKGAMAIATKMGKKAREHSEKAKAGRHRREADASSEGSELEDEISSGESGQESDVPLTQSRTQSLPEKQAKRRKTHSVDLVEVIALSISILFIHVY